MISDLILMSIIIGIIQIISVFINKVCIFSLEKVFEREEDRRIKISNLFSSLSITPFVFSNAISIIYIMYILELNLIAIKESLFLNIIITMIIFIIVTTFSLVLYDNITKDSLEKWAFKKIKKKNLKKEKEKYRNERIKTKKINTIIMFIGTILIITIYFLAR